MQIGQGVHQIGRAHQEGFSTLGQWQFLVQQETEVSCTQLDRGKIHGCKLGSM